MINEWQVLKWLNRNSHSQLSFEFQNILKQIGPASTLPENKKQMLLNDLMSQAPILPNLAEQAELQFNCALYCYARGNTLDALSLLRCAQQIYQNAVDLHREAMSEWLMFIIQHGQGDHEPASYWANKARTNLWSMVKISGQQKIAQHEQFYLDRVYDLTTDLFNTPEYVYQFIFEFHGSYLGLSASTIKCKIQELMLDRKHEEACRQMDFLQKKARGTLEENAEALAFSGLMRTEIGDLMDACRLYQMALAQILPGSHDSVMIRWILALTQREIPGLKGQSMENMEKCVDQTLELAQWADHQNLQIQHTWYELTSEGMRRITKLTAAK